VGQAHLSAPPAAFDLSCTSRPFAVAAGGDALPARGGGPLGGDGTTKGGDGTTRGGDGTTRGGAARGAGLPGAVAPPGSGAALGDDGVPGDLPGGFDEALCDSGSGRGLLTRAASCGREPDGPGAGVADGMGTALAAARAGDGAPPGPNIKT
jgi:hypothetical protein